MLFSKTCEYGIRATIFIAHNSLLEQRSSLKEISKAVEAPEAFTAKILQTLVRNNILVSTKGATGGFDVEVKKMKKIKLIDIVSAIDSNFDNKLCVLGMKECSAKHPCPVHHKYKDIKSDIKIMLETTTLHEMSLGINEGKTWLNF